MTQPTVHVSKPSSRRVPNHNRVNETSSIRNGAIFAGAMAMQRGISALLLPLYLRALSPGEYGEVALVLAAAAGVSAVLGFGLDAAIFRNYFKLKENPEEQKAFLSTVGSFLLVAPIAFVCLLLFATLVYSPIQRDILAVGLLAAALQTTVTVFPFSVLRSEERPMKYMWINVQYSLVLAALLFAFVIVFRWGAMGWMAANFLAWVSVLPLSLNVLKRYWVGIFKRKHLYLALAFSIPLIPHMLGHWGLALSDRLILDGFVSKAELGVYSAGYQAAALLGMLLTGSNWAFLSRYTRGNEASSSLGKLRRVVGVQAVVTIVLSLLCFAFLPLILEMLLPSSFAGAAQVARIVTVANLFYGLYMIPMNVLSMWLGETRWIWVATLAALVVNIAFNFAYIPVMGINAAAWSTLLGYLALFVGAAIYLVARSGAGRSNLKLVQEV